MRILFHPTTHRRPPNTASPRAEEIRGRLAFRGPLGVCGTRGLNPITSSPFPAVTQMMGEQVL